MPKADLARWGNRQKRLSHFRKHGPLLNQQDVDDYDKSARATIRAGKRFTYEDTTAGEQRVGYYDRHLERLTALDEVEETIVTHFRCPERYVRSLPASDYSRR